MRGDETEEPPADYGRPAYVDAYAMQRRGDRVPILR
jgi:hypothetical protein